jgi:hypothetical protein
MFFKKGEVMDAVDTLPQELSELCAFFNLSFAWGIPWPISLPLQVQPEVPFPSTPLQIL